MATYPTTFGPRRLASPEGHLSRLSHASSKFEYNPNGGQRVKQVWQRHSNWRQGAYARRKRSRRAVCP